MIALPIQCRVCGRREHKDTTGWLLCTIDRRNAFHATPELDGRNHEYATFNSIGAFACDEECARTLFGRYLRRGTFEPIHIRDIETVAELLRA